MDETVLRAVERAIATMETSLGERLTIDDLARSAMFSKFHFSRMFQRVTGVSPGRFLSAIRINEAKRLLLSTTLAVADISHQVGYNSVGTFSSRFHRSVGVSPTTYRQLGGVPRLPSAGAPPAAGAVPTRALQVGALQVAALQVGAPQVGAVPVRALPAGALPATTTLRGHITVPPGSRSGPIFVGLFPGRILEAPPVAATIVRHPGPYVLTNVPPGSWHLLATSASIDPAEPVPFVGCTGPMTVRAEVTAHLADIRLRRQNVLDPPILMVTPVLVRHDLAA